MSIKIKHSDSLEKTPLDDHCYDELSISAILDLFPRPPILASLPVATSLHLHGSSRICDTSVSQQSIIATPNQQRSAATLASGSAPFLAQVTANSNLFGTAIGTGQSGSSNSMVSGSANSVSTSISICNSAANSTTAVALSSSSSNPASVNCLGADGFIDPDRFHYSLPPGVPELDYIDLLKRACRGIIAPLERDSLVQFLLSQPPSKIMQLQRSIHQLLAESKSIIISMGLAGKQHQQMATVELSKYSLDFQLKGRQAKLNEILTDRIVIEGKTGQRIKYSVILPKSNRGSFDLSIDSKTTTLSGKLKPKESIDITITLRIKRPLKLAEMICIDVEGGLQHFIAFSVSSEPSEFGLRLSETELAEDTILGRKHSGIPRTLVSLRRMLLQRNGLEVEEIFRKQIDEENLILLRRQFDQRQSLDQLTAEQISMLIKLWFREFPDRLFEDGGEGTVSGKSFNDSLLKCDTAEQSLAIYSTCQSNCRSVLDWALDLLCEVVEQREKNRMTSKKISIVMAPNLLPSSAVDGSQLNAELLRKKAEFINHLLNQRLCQVPSVPNDR